VTRDSWRVLLVCALAVFLAGFDGSILFVVLPAVGHDLHADVGALAQLGSVLALGSAIAIPLARIADRGRRGIVLALAVAGFSVVALGAALSPSLAALAVIRFFAVGFETVVGAVATAAVVEHVERHHRARAVSVLSLAGGAGYGVVVIVYPFVAPHWRDLYFAAAALTPVAAAMLLLPARAHPLRHDAGIATLARAPWLPRLAVLGGSAVVGALLYEPAGLFGVYYGSHTLRMGPAALSAVIFVSGVFAAAGYAVGGLTSDRWGRRLPAVVLSCLTAILTGLTFAGVMSLYLAGNFVSSLVGSAAAPIAGAWTAELFPTSVRATAFAVAGFVGAVGGILALQVHALLAGRMGQGSALLLVTPVAIAGTLLLLLLPETVAQPLAEEG